MITLYYSLFILFSFLPSTNNSVAGYEGNSVGSQGTGYHSYQSGDRDRSFSINGKFTLKFNVKENINITVLQFHFLF